MMAEPLLSQQIQDFVGSYGLDAKQSKILEYYLRSACKSFQENKGSKGELRFTGSACKKIISGGEEFLAGLSELGDAGGSIEAIKSAQILVEGIAELARTTRPPSLPRGNKRNEIIPTFIFPLMAGYHLAFGERPTVIKNRHGVDSDGQNHKLSDFHVFFERAIKLITGETVNVKASTLQDYLKTLRDIFDKHSPHEIAGIDTGRTYDAFLEGIRMPEIQERR